MSSPRFDNPLDTLFNVEPSAQDHPMVEMSEAEIAALQAPPDTPVEKDADDVAIDGKIDEVYDSAIQTFKDQMSYIDIIEPRYAARNAEVAANFLSIALNAAATKARVKEGRKKSQQFIPYGRNPNGAVMASREDILKALAVDGEIKEIKR